MSVVRLSSVLGFCRIAIKEIIKMGKPKSKKGKAASAPKQNGGNATAKKAKNGGKKK